jgi:hypothetical protein
MGLTFGAVKMMRQCFPPAVGVAALLADATPAVAVPAMSRPAIPAVIHEPLLRTIFSSPWIPYDL